MQARTFLAALCLLALPLAPSAAAAADPHKAAAAQAHAGGAAPPLPDPVPAGLHVAAGSARSDALRPTPFLIGGAPVPAAQAPAYMVRVLEAGGSFGFCSGTLISPFAVLTAAHCAWDDFAGAPAAPDGLNVLVGTAVRGGLGGTRVPVAAVHVHPDYDPAAFDHDLAVLMLGKPQKGPYAQLASTPPSADAPVRAYGWGATASGLAPLRLFKADLFVVDNDACNGFMSDVPDALVTPTMLCAGADGKGSCSGDSGGPLLLGATQVGVTTWGVRDGDGNCLTMSDGRTAGYPSVFSSIPALYSFAAPFRDLVGFQVDLAQPWVLDGALEVSLSGSPVDRCAVALGVAWRGIACETAPAGLAGRSPLLYLPPAPQKYTFTFQAQDGEGLPLSEPASVASAGRAAALTRMTLPLKATVAVVQVKPDPVYAFLTVRIPSTEETCLVPLYAVRDLQCTGTQLLPLAYPYLAIRDGGEALPQSLTVLGGGYENVVDPVVVTLPAAVPVRLKVGAVTQVAARLSLDPVVFGGVDLKGAKASAWSATLWLHDGPDPVAACDMFTLAAYHSADCLGAGVVGLRGGKVAIALGGDPLAVDVEAGQVQAGQATAAIAEDVRVEPGAFTAVTLKFGPAVVNA